MEKVYHGEYVDSSEQLAANFFYTMVSNFSHYAYNIYDFRREWTSIKEKAMMITRGAGFTIFSIRMMDTGRHLC